LLLTINIVIDIAYSCSVLSVVWILKNATLVSLISLCSDWLFSFVNICNINFLTAAMLGGAYDVAVCGRLAAAM